LVKDEGLWPGTNRRLSIPDGQGAILGTVLTC
jgi:hypothetical protein